jgi:hypothetical protein
VRVKGRTGEGEKKGEREEGRIGYKIDMHKG